MRSADKQAKFPPNQPIIVDIRINETLQPGAVSNRTYRGCASVSLFLDFTIIQMRFALSTLLYTPQLQNRSLVAGVFTVSVFNQNLLIKVLPLVP